MRSDLDRLCERLGITAECVYGAAVEPCSWDAAHNWRVTLRMGRRRLSVDFYGGAAVTEPSAADVLSSLLLDTASTGQSFGSWCDDLGYDRDSRKAEATYNACRKLAPKVRRFCGEHFDTLGRASH